MAFNLAPHALLFTIAAIGISETAYLISKRKAAEKPVCPIGEGCETVLTSKYNRVFFGIHNDIAGLLFYIFMSLVMSFLVLNVGPIATWTLLMQAALIIATSMSLLFTYVQWKVIKAWCFWCLMSAATVVLMDIIVIGAKII